MELGRKGRLIAVPAVLPGTGMGTRVNEFVLAANAVVVGAAGRGYRNHVLAVLGADVAIAIRSAASGGDDGGSRGACGDRRGDGAGSAGDAGASRRARPPRQQRSNGDAIGIDDIGSQGLRCQPAPG